MSVADRIASLNWQEIADGLGGRGHAVIEGLLDPGECAELIGLYDDDRNFRSRIDMARHGFGLGDYAYFRDPLPRAVTALREGLYEGLAPIADRTMADLGREAAYPASHAEYRSICAAAGQTKPTPLLLRYGADGFNCLHRDLYGQLAFPFQVTLLLSDPDRDFSGGEFLLVENRPRQQSRGEAVRLEQGSAIVFPVSERPVPSKRGMSRAQMRHGVSRVRSGQRYTLGIIFHDAA